MLTTRLQTILELLPEVDSVIDVGTDHCLLPIAIKQKFPSMEVAASDVAKGPLLSAQKQLQEYKVSDIELFLSNGLQSISKQYDSVIIAGMGANTMIEIMENNLDYCKNCKYMILQANKDLDILRQWLMNHGFMILDEKIVFDYKYYQILLICPKQQELSYEDIVFGPILRQQRSDVFIDFWKQELDKYQNISKQLPDSHPRKIEANQMIQLIENEIK